MKNTEKRIAQYCTLYVSVLVVGLYTVFMFFSLPLNLVKTLAKKQVKHLAKNLANDKNKQKHEKKNKQQT